MNGIGTRRVEERRNTDDKNNETTGSCIQATFLVLRRSRWGLSAGSDWLQPALTRTNPPTQPGTTTSRLCLWHPLLIHSTWPDGVLWLLVGGDGVQELFGKLDNIIWRLEAYLLSCSTSYYPWRNSIHYAFTAYSHSSDYYGAFIAAPRFQPSSSSYVEAYKQLPRHPHLYYCCE